MPHTLSTKKRNRQNTVRHQRNISRLNRIRTYIKILRTQIEKYDVKGDIGDKSDIKIDKDTIMAAFRKATSELHKAAQKRVIKSNKASRLISRLNRLVKAKIS